MSAVIAVLASPLGIMALLALALVLAAPQLFDRPES